MRKIKMYANSRYSLEMKTKRGRSHLRVEKTLLRHNNQKT